MSLGPKRSKSLERWSSRRITLMVNSRFFFSFQETPTCHTNLTKAVKEFDLKETDVHDVFNIFMCSGFTRTSHEYFVKVSDPVLTVGLGVKEILLMFARTALFTHSVGNPCHNDSLKK